MSAALGATVVRAPGAAPPGQVRRAAWLGVAVVSAVVALVSSRYVANFGPMPPNIAANRFVRPWIAVHAGGAATALFLGPLQLLPGLRRRCAGGLAGMILAIGTSAGPVAAASFVTLDMETDVFVVSAPSFPAA